MAGMGSETEIEEGALFATQLFSRQLPASESAALNAALLFAIKDLFEADRTGIERSNLRALGGWHSQLGLHRQPAFAPLVTHIDAFAAEISRRNGYSTRHRLAITGMWAIVNAPGSYNQTHVHPGSHWSGAYYVQAPEGSGDITFTDPRTEAMMQPLLHEGPRPEALRHHVSVPPVAGRMLMFPSWLQHGVKPNLSRARGGAAERVVTSFNLSQQPLSGPPAA
ncbi:hypothetical protein PSA7680_00468 [Pseudoruegeria aquimaris]|uniref:Fe2OG dioxygenase domain-containing protein n=1 Tax=Pseudoruegeria aquimaris TaxID=393663 RepID=A0A1Y5RHR7_9RHOB|nr:TIGR02466 family protein [Pseudoruegeria aquimaris]SLN16597.1 hypothetical protein PSA7680_00468 [Pseudoruegeria aquimaris]